MSNYNSTLQSNNTDLQAILNTINELPEASNGVELPTLTNEGTSADLLSGKQLIDGEGNIVEGAIAIKTSSDITASGNTVTVPIGYYATQGVAVVPAVDQATPSITINSSGLITATATQTAGYVSAGTKSATKQLAFQAAKTITPTTASQIAVSSGYYTGGNVMVAGDSNLVAENIKNGVDIFGIVGTLQNGSENEDAIVSGTISSYYNDRVTTIRDYAFYGYSKLTTVNFPAATTIGGNAFCGCYSLTTASFPAATTISIYAFCSCSSLTTISFPAATYIKLAAFENCSKLTTASFPAVSTIGDGAFRSCSKLTTASFPAASYIGSNAFRYCYSLTTASFPAATYIYNYAFGDCRSLTTVSFPAASYISSYAFRNCSSLSKIYLTASSICKLVDSYAFSGTSIWSTIGSIFVPSSLVASYKTATNWAFFSNRIYSA